MFSKGFGRSLVLAIIPVVLGIGVIAPEAHATKRIVLVGDSWTQWPWKSGAFQTVLNSWFSSGMYEVEGTYTAIGGSAAAMWAANADPGTSTFPTWDGQPHGLLDRLDYTLAMYPSIDIMHISLGGIDLLATWRAGFTTEQEQTLFQNIYDNVQIVVNHVKAIRPNMRFLWVDYDFLNITETCTYGFSEFSWTAYYSATALGFTVGDFYQNRANNETMNRAFGRCALRKIDFVHATPYVDYLQDFGNVQWRAGYTNSIGTLWGPGAVPFPGQYPSYAPLPGGNPQYGTPPVLMDHPDANTVDPIHLSPQGYKYLFDNALANYYYRWLTDTTAPVCTGIRRASANPTNAGSVAFTVTFSEDVTWVGANDFAIDASGVTGAAITNVSGSGSTYTVTVSTGTGDGALSIDLINGSTVWDRAWLPLASGYSSGEAYTIDKTRPTVSMSSTLLPGPTSTAPIPVTVTFSEPVTGFTLTDVTVSNALAANLWGSGANYGFELLPSDNGLVQADIAASCVQDQAGQTNAAGAHFQITYDTGGAGRSIYQSDGSLGNLTPDAASTLTINTTTNSINWTSGGAPYTRTGRVSDGVCVFDFAGVTVPNLTVTLSGNKPLSIAATTDMSVAASFSIAPGTLGGGLGGLGGTGATGGAGGAGGTGGAGGMGGKGGYGEDYYTHSLSGDPAQDCVGDTGSNGSGGNTGGDGIIGTDAAVPPSNAGSGGKGYGDPSGIAGPAGQPGANAPGGAGAGGSLATGVGSAGSGAGGGGARGWPTGTGGTGSTGGGGGNATNNGSAGSTGANGAQGGAAAYSDATAISNSLAFVAGNGGGGGGGAAGGGGGGGGAGGGGGQGGGGGGGGNFAEASNQRKCTGGAGGGGGGGRGGSGGGAGGGGGGGGGGAGGLGSGSNGVIGNAATSGGSQPGPAGAGSTGNAGAGWLGDGLTWYLHPGPEGGSPGSGGPGGAGGTGGGGGSGGAGGQGASGGGSVVLATRGLLTVSSAVDVSAAAPANGGNGVSGGNPSNGASGLAGTGGGSGGSGGSVQNPSIPWDTTTASSGGAGGQGGSGGAGSTGGNGGKGGDGGLGGYGTPGCVKLHGTVIKAAAATVSAGNVSSANPNNNGIATLISNMTAAKVGQNDPAYSVASTVQGTTTNDVLLKGIAVYDTSKTSPLIPTLAGGPATSGYCLTNYWNKTETDAKLAGLNKPEIAKFEAGIDSYFQGYHQIVIVNTNASATATGVYLKVGSYPAFPIGGTGTLAPLQAWTTCVEASIAIGGIQLINPVFITQQPVGANLYVGQSHTLQVLTNGGVGTVHYQWHRGESDLSGATLNHYDITSALLSDAGAYTCAVTDDAVSIASDPATVAVADLPTITSQPQSRNAYAGDQHTFSVTVTGGIGTLTYQWKKNGGNVPGQTTSTYTLNPLATGDSGSYYCEVKDALGTVAQPIQAATLQVANPIQITGQPSGGTYALGASHTFACTATGGYGTLHYQWLKDGAIISGATTATYPKTNLQAVDSGHYVCVVTDDWGTPKPSDAASLYVGSGPALSVGDLPDGVGYLGRSFSFTVSTTGGYGALSCQWYKGGDPVAGATTSVYTINPVAQGDDNTRYKCLVGDAFESLWTPLAPRTEAILRVAPPIEITVQPEGANKAVGDSHTFSVAATGGFGTLTYQWKKDGHTISGATSNACELASLTTEDAGTYLCDVSDEYSTIPSNEALLTVTPHAVPAAGLMALAGACAAAGIVSVRRRR